jgi:hypothetical protein
VKPGHRVDLIRQIADSLSQYEWEDIDLVLRQFDLSWSDSWHGQGGKTGYVIEHIENGNDDKLLELREYLLGGDDEQPDLSDLTGPWVAQRFRLFASHLHVDCMPLSELKAALQIYGIDTFVAHEDIEPTTEWQTEIERALDTCDAALAYLTPNFHDSLWVDQEVGYCINRRILIVPLRLGLDPYGLMGKYQGLQGVGPSSTETAHAIFELLIRHNLTAGSMAAGLIGRLEDAENYETANRLAGLLEKVETWSPGLLRRLENVPKANSQVAEGWTAQRVIPRILREQRT